MINQQVIEHYGVKGMRWGVRKSRTPSSEASEVAKLRKKKAFELTDAELAKVNKRLNLEREFNRLNPSRMAKAKASVKNALNTSIGRKLMKDVVAQVATTYAKRVIEDKFDMKFPENNKKKKEG